MSININTPDFWLLDSGLGLLTARFVVSTSRSDFHQRVAKSSVSPRAGCSAVGRSRLRADWSCSKARWSLFPFNLFPSRAMKTRSDYKSFSCSGFHGGRLRALGTSRRTSEGRSDSGGLRRSAEVCGGLLRSTEVCGGLRRSATGRRGLASTAATRSMTQSGSPSCCLDRRRKLAHWSLSDTTARSLAHSPRASSNRITSFDPIARFGPIAEARHAHRNQTHSAPQVNPRQ